MSLGTTGSRLVGFSVWSTEVVCRLPAGQYASLSGSQFFGAASTINNPITGVSGNVTGFRGIFLQCSQLIPARIRV